MDFTGANPSFTDATYAGSTANLTVNNATALNKDAFATYYLAVKPFSATSGQKLTVAVNGYEKDIDLTNDVTFVPGKIKTINFGYDKVATEAIFGSDWNTLFGTSYSGSFSPAKGSLNLSGEVNGVSVTVKNPDSTAGYVATSDFRCYNGYTMVISAPSGKSIKAISTTKGNKAYSDGISANEGTGTISDSKYSWTGDSPSVTLTFTGTVSFATITVTYGNYVAVPSIRLTSSETESVVAAGDVITTTYSLINPDPELSVSATSDKSWVNNFDLSVAGEVSYVVDENSTDAERSATVTISYGTKNVTVTINQGKKGGTNTTSFTPSDFEGQGTSSTGSSVSCTKDDITVSTGKGYGTTQFRVYQGGTLSISSAAGNIKSISFEFSSSYKGGLNASYSDVNAKTWTKTTSSQARITSISVEYYTE